MARGTLRVYLGAAPGVGKTYAMLDEGHRRAERGADVVVAVVETHGRARTAAQIGDLPVVPRQVVTYRGAQFDELDRDAVLARRPQLALVDELAHTNVPGSGRHDKRWQDVEDFLAAGIDVISTVNVQHIESLNDVVGQITGTVQRETVPDSMVRSADQIELVDMSPEALRRRMAHGNIYPSEKIDAALANYFRPGNLTALRELALLWLAGRVEEGMQRYRAQHGITGTWETRERIVVALTGGPEGEALIRRAARIAARSAGAEWMAVHVSRGDGLAARGLAPGGPAALETQRLLVESLGGSYHLVVGDSVPRSLLDFARSVDATQVVLGASRRRPWIAALTGPGTSATVTRLSGSIDVHMVSHDYAGRGPALPPLGLGLTVRRQAAGALAAVVLLVAATLVLAANRSHFTLASDLSIYLLIVVVVSVIGGFYPALGTALVGGVLVNYYFTPPIHRFTINRHDNLIAVAIFLLVALLVSRVVDVSARRSALAGRAGAEAETLSTLAGSLLRGEQALTALLDRVRETFGMTSVSLLERTDGGGSTWAVLASTGPDAPQQPGDGDGTVDIDEHRVLALRGRRLPAEDQRVLSAFAAQVAVAYRQRELTEVARSLQQLAESERARTALLNAVSHDLRTPIAAAKASVASLRAGDVQWSDEDRRELLATAETALDRLTDLVTNLLDLSRLQAGVLPVLATPVGLDDVVARALDHALAPGVPVEVVIPADLPAVCADAGLLERVVANLVQNAVRYAPPDRPVRLAGSTHAGRVELRVIDHGPGIASDAADAVFAAFQRGHDSPSDGAGVGLGLAIARGFAEAMGGTVTAEITPGGGATFVVALVAADAGDAAGGGHTVTRVLIVEDERPLLRALAMNLTARGFEVIEADTGTRALTAAAAQPPDVILLDLGLPDLSGLDVIRAVRQYSATPIVVLSARTGSSEKVAALDLGADDYVTKPFSIEELLARVRAVTRRAPAAEPALAVPVGTNRVDLDAKTVTDAAGQRVHLTPTEWHLLEALVRRPGRLVTGKALLTELRGTPEHTDPSYLRIYMAQLRRKLEPEPSRPRHFVTEPGMGYRFQP